MAKVSDTEENMKKCICGQCPSYNQCMNDKNEGLYCARGESVCQFEENGCLCGSCPVASEFRLDQTYFCSTGKAE